MVELYIVSLFKGFHVNFFPVVITVFCRQWAIFDENGSLIALKEKPSLALIKPVIVESEGCLVVKGPGMDTLRIPLTAPGTQEAKALRLMIPLCVCMWGGGGGGGEGGFQKMF